MDKDALLRALPAGLARVRGDIQRLVQDAVRLATHAADEAQIAIGASKLGGAPDLPTGAAWPAYKNASMSFVAQIQLSDARPFDAAHRLPATGLLLFFYDARQQTYGADPADRGGWQVLYVAGRAPQLQRAAPPADLPAAARFAACTLAFAREATLPQSPEAVLPKLDWTSDQQRIYGEFVATLPGSADRFAPRHQLLGHPDTIQDDMHLQCALASHGVSSVDDPRAAELVKSAPSWQLLLQVDSDDRAGMRWGSAGMLYYWVEQPALRHGEFSNVWLVLQSE